MREAERVNYFKRGRGGLSGSWRSTLRLRRVSRSPVPAAYQPARSADPRGATAANAMEGRSRFASCRCRLRLSRSDRLPDNGQSNEESRGRNDHERYLADPVASAGPMPGWKALQLKHAERSDQDRSADSATSDPNHSHEEENRKNGRTLPEADEERVRELTKPKQQGDQTEQPSPITRNRKERRSRCHSSSSHR